MDLTFPTAVSPRPSERGKFVQGFFFVRICFRTQGESEDKEVFTL